MHVPERIIVLTCIGCGAMGQFGAFSVFMEAIFIGIYIYGWGRLSPRAHLLSGIPIVFTGFTGSWMVIAVNAWMNHPGGFQLHGGKVSHVDPFQALFANSYLWH